MLYVTAPVKTLYWDKMGLMMPLGVVARFSGVAGAAAARVERKAVARPAKSILDIFSVGGDVNERAASMMGIIWGRGIYRD